MRYFHDAHLAQEVGGKALDKADYVEERALWLAIECARLRGAPRVLLLDEIDKAPKPFPNGLLLELDRMELTVAVPEHMFDQTVSG